MKTKSQVYLNKVLEIEREIERLIDDQRESGLLVGLVGITTFYEGLYSITQEKKFQKKCHQTLQKVLDSFSSDDLKHTFCAGFTGMAWGVQHLIDRKVAKFKADTLFADIDKYIYASSIQDLNDGLYDYMHGGSGAAVYALKRLPNQDARQFLEQYVDHIEAMKHVDEFGYKWADIFSDIVDQRDRNHSRFSLGLSHGVPSVLMILTKIYKMGIKKEQTSNLISKGLSWLEHVRDISPTKISVYPSWLIGTAPSLKDSRLGWCYGDLGIALIFLNAGRILGNKKWIQYGRKLVKHSLKRLDPAEGRIFDAGFCHGTSGVAHIFKKLYQQTQIPECITVHNYWIEETLKMSKFEDGLAGYKVLKSSHLDKNSIWINDLSLIEGISGIGLVLLSHLGLSDEWDECFLLSA